MHLDPRDTIAAIGTASGGAARGMIRVSGPDTVACIDRCFRALDSDACLTQVNSAQVVAGELHLREQDISLPCELLLWPNEQSYTRQPAAELHSLGSPPLLEASLETLCRQGARMAEPGEFTLRAFFAGRLDLTQAEAVLGVIDATDPSSFNNALGQLAGGLSKPLSVMREQLLNLLAHLEAGLDFVDEDITFISAEEITSQLKGAQQTIADTLAQLANRGEPQVLGRAVLIGAPNAGKSSLFNALVTRYGSSDTGDAALVSPQAGTTRDFLSAILDVNDKKFQLIDTAGIETSVETASIASQAQKMTSSQYRHADCMIFCFDTSDSAPESKFVTRSNSQLDDSVLYVLTKTDLLQERFSAPAGLSAIRCSSRTGAGIAELASAIAAKLEESPVSGAVASTATRCLDSLHRAEESVQAALALVASGRGDELVAVEIRTALNELGRVVGAVYTDDILDRIFGQFCIGK